MRKLLDIIFPEVAMTSRQRRVDVVQWLRLADCYKTRLQKERSVRNLFTRLRKTIAQRTYRGATKFRAGRGNPRIHSFQVGLDSRVNNLLALWLWLRC